jgi:hypothetical protein
MAIKIQNTSSIELTAVKTVVYGGAGVGKTRLCASAPTPIIISAESGLLSLADSNVDFIEITKLRDLDEAYRWSKSSAEASQYETIGLDSLSEIAEVLIAEIKPSHKDARQAYGALADAMMPMLRKFRDLPDKHTVFTSKLIQIQDEESGTISQQLLMPGKVLGYQIPYMVDELFCMQIDRKGVPFLQTAPDRMRFCKDRSGALDNPEKPDMSVIINKIMTKGNK